MIPILDFLSPLIDKALSFIPDPAQKEKAREELNRHAEVIITTMSQIDQKQADTNIAEASVTGSDWFKIFMAGWRPALGWICVLSFAWVFVIQPVTVFILDATGHHTEFPVLNISELITLLGGMLGLSTQRMFEKQQGVQGNH